MRGVEKRAVVFSRRMLLSMGIQGLLQHQNPVVSVLQTLVVKMLEPCDATDYHSARDKNPGRGFKPQPCNRSALGLVDAYFRTRSTTTDS